MVQLILDQLVNGIPLSAISSNISSQADLSIPGVKVIVQQLPITNFIRSCRAILQIIGKTLAGYRIEKVEQWDQLFSDRTVRHKTSLHHLVIGIIYEERLHPLIISTSIIPKVETSE